MPELNLKDINRKMKSFINEATGISERCRKKLLKLIEKHFFVTLPKENYLNIDIEILKNGNVKMRDIEYKTEKELLKDDELLERFSLFEEEVNLLLDNNATDFDIKKKKGNISNILILMLYFIVIVALIHDGIRKLLRGDFMGIAYLGFMIFNCVLPYTGNRFKERLERAKRYLKTLINK